MHACMHVCMFVCIGHSTILVARRLARFYATTSHYCLALLHNDKNAYPLRIILASGRMDMGVSFKPGFYTCFKIFVICNLCTLGIYFK